MEHVDCPPLILASASPRRKSLLEDMGCVFTVKTADIDESQAANELPEDHVLRLAREKALAVQKSLRLDASGEVVSILAADTIVEQDGVVFGKPRDQQHAIQMWKSLQNARHCVMTAVCLAYRDRIETRLVSSSVEFDPISDEQMQRYWLSGEPQDKAGAYAIQGLASAWVKLVSGSYTNVVGLPLRETNQLLRLVGHNWL